MSRKNTERRAAALPHKVSFSESFGSIVSEKDFLPNDTKLQNSKNTDLQEYAKNLARDNFVLWLDGGEIKNEFSVLPEEKLFAIKPSAALDYITNLLPESLQNIYKNTPHWKLEIKEKITKPLILILSGQNNDVQIEAAENSALTLIEETSSQFINSCCFRNFNLADSASVKHNIARWEKKFSPRLQSYFSFSFLKANNLASYERVGLNMLDVILRDEFHVELAEHTNISIAEACLAREKNRASYYWPVCHNQANSSSRQRFHAALTDYSRVEFFGRIQVPPHAQKTNAEQQSRFLMLSENAQAKARPELEILADDVKCKHGAAIGALDKMALFYLQARGLDEMQARMLLVEAFIADIAQDFSTPWLCDSAKAAIGSWLSGDLEKRLF
jgi:hypothetical protein